MSDLVISAPAADTMTSVEIAELCGKRHDNVLADLRKLDAEGVIGLLKFQETALDVQNKERTIYNLPKRETLILTSGYSATQRATIIDRWLALEGGPKTMLEVVAANAAAMVVQDRRLTAIEHRLDSLSGGTGYQTILAWGRTTGERPSLSEAKSLGMACSRYCKKAGITMGKVPDERWGSVKSYPTEVIDEVFKALP